MLNSKFIPNDPQNPNQGPKVHPRQPADLASAKGTHLMNIHEIGWAPPIAPNFPQTTLEEHEKKIMVHVPVNLTERATPIPRTVALQDLVTERQSTIDELPKKYLN